MVCGINNVLTDNSILYPHQLRYDYLNELRVTDL